MTRTQPRRPAKATLAALIALVWVNSHFVQTDHHRPPTYPPHDPANVRRLAALSPGDVLFERVDAASGVRRWIVNAALTDAYPHTGILAEDPRFMVESTAVGVVRSPVANLTHPGDRRALARYELWRPRCAPEVRRRAIALASSRLGRTFGWRQGAGLILDQHGLQAAASLAAGAADDVTCAGLVAWAYASAGFPLVDGLPLFATGPAEIRHGGRLTRVW